MDREACIEQIMNHGMEVLFELRQNRLSREHYSPFIQALKSYREMIRGEKKIEREIAGALDILAVHFLPALDYTELHNREEQELIRRAHEKFVSLMMDIFNPESDAHSEGK